MIQFLLFGSFVSGESETKTPTSSPISTGQIATSTSAGPVCSNAKSTRGFEVELWQEGAPQALKEDEQKFNQFLQEMVQFACEKQIDRIFVTIQDPSQWPSGTVNVFTNVLTSAPEWMEIGFLLNVNPKYPWTWKSSQIPPGMDSSLFQAITFVKEVNAAAAASGSSKRVTIFGGDGENNGVNADNFCTWREVTFSVMDDDEYVEKIKFMQAKQGSLNGPALFQAAQYNQQHVVGKDPSQSCGTIDNYLARPELYWYMDELKQKGCIGCPAHTPLQPTMPDQCTRYNGDKCSSIPKCNTFNTHFKNGDLYDQCIAQTAEADGCPEDCCKCFGCVPCGYDQDGKAPNPAIFYQTERSNPVGMKDAILKGMQAGHLLDTIGLAQTAPMFSIEMSHSLFSDAVQAAGPNNDSNTCMARHYAGKADEICGTFDGMGSMTYENLIKTFELLHQEKGWKTFTVYEWAFVPLSWLGKSNPQFV